MTPKDPVELQQEMDFRRHQVLNKAIETVDRKVLEVSDGSTEITNFLTGIAALKLVHRSVETILPSGWQMPAEICQVEGLSPKMMEEVEKGVCAGLSVIHQEVGPDKIVISHLITELAEEFVRKVRIATGSRLLAQDIQETHKE